MDQRLENLEKSVAAIRDAQAEIRTGQAVNNKAVEGIEKSLAMLTDLRAETLHLMKMQDHDHKEHDEVFERLRNVEKENAGARLNKLETNQRWGVVTIIGLILVNVFKHIFFPVP